MLWQRKAEKAEWPKKGQGEDRGGRVEVSLTRAQEHDSMTKGPEVVRVD